MFVRSTVVCSALPTLLACLLSLSPDATAQHAEYVQDHATPQDILVRRTIPHPRAVERAPLTSDRLSTTSTRLIDARRGHRPYSSVHRGTACGFRHARYAGYDDNFGITRPSYRPYSYSPPRTTDVMRFSNSNAQPAQPSARQAPLVIINPAVAQPASADKPKRKMKIRIHHDTPELPTSSGGVLIMSDGTVIQIGE